MAACIHFALVCQRVGIRQECCPSTSYACTGSALLSKKLLKRCNAQQDGTNDSRIRYKRLGCSSAKTKRDTIVQSNGKLNEPILEGLDTNYCDDFVCTSSPAVEQTVRALARDLTRVNTWTRSLFSSSVQYQDPLRAFKGLDKYNRLNYLATNIQQSKVLVTRMQMLDKGTAVLSWRLRGLLYGLPLDINFQSEFQLNLLTGRVERHRDSWDLSKCSLPASIAFQLNRFIWSATQKSIDAKEGTKKVLDSFSSVDEDDGPDIYANPTDPTKFFQQEDNGFQDAVTVATLIAILYLMAQAWFQLSKLK